MKRIKTLTLKNFKFFYGEEQIDFDQKNVLIYGENGSGKSSIYWALYTFLQSSVKENDVDVQKYFDSTKDEKLRNVFANNTDESFVKLELQDHDGNSESFTISKNLVTTNKTNTTIKKANYASDFINHRPLMRIFDFKNSENIDLFPLFERDILAYISTPNGSMLIEWEMIYSCPKPGRVTKQFLKWYKSEISKFNSDLERLINSINEPANKYLQNNFNEKIFIKLKLSQKTEYRSYDDEFLYLTLPEISLEVKFFDESILRPHTFLNEAKLTAIALSIRLAVLERRLSDSDLKILLLDDLLISLDMSHRKTLLNILMQLPIFREFQIIMMTHDKTFFEYSKKIFEREQPGEWNYYGLFIDETQGFESQYIKKYYNYFEEAERFFRVKDYSAAANSLRREGERLLTNLLDLPDNHSLTLHGLIEKSEAYLNEQNNSYQMVKRLIENIDKNLPNNYETLINNGFTTASPKEKGIVTSKLKSVIKLKKEIDKLEIKDPKKTTLLEVLKKLKDVKDLILNPQSHHDIISPLYQKEIDDAMQIIRKLKEQVEHNETIEFVI